MSDVNTAVLKIAKLRLVADYLEALGSTREQAETAASAHADQFAYSGAVLTFKGEVAGTPGMETAVRGWFNEKKLDFLIGTKSNAGGDAGADAVLVERARSGNKTAQGQLFLKLDKDQSKYDAVMKRKPFNAPDDEPLDEPTKENGGKNPWSAAGWNVTEQGRILRAQPKLAASLAASAKSRIGATHPTKAA